MEIVGNRLKPDGHGEGVRLKIYDGRIADVHVYDECIPDAPFVLPGFIDVHVHGGGGADTMDATEDAFATIARTHARFGTTGILLTTVTETPERVMSVLECISAMSKESTGELSQNGAKTESSYSPEWDGAAVLGVHLEGPFIHPSRPGAQRKDLILNPDVNLARTWFDTGCIRMMTLAPEQPDAHAVVKEAANRGIVVSAGHTEASFSDMMTAKRVGVSHLTHLCNAMSPLLHRAPGPIGAVVDDDDFTADLIADGIHLTPAMIKVLIRSIGIERLLLITDAIRAAAMPDGIYELGGLAVTVQDGACRLANGTLAGSVLTMDKAFHNIQRFGGASMYDAQRMGAENPARRLGLKNKGRVASGYDADLTAMNDQGEIIWTMVGGRIVFERS